MKFSLPGHLSLLSLWIPFFLSGCLVHQPSESVQPSVPAAAVYQQIPDAKETSAAELEAWWESFEDPALDGLVAEALESNLELRQLTEGIEQAETLLRQTGGRFRPIFLTAINTFLGLGPMIFETSIQALFLVPMAISLGIGTLVSSLVILILIPAVFTILEEFGRKQRTEEPITPEPQRQPEPQSEPAPAAVQSD